MGEVCKARDPRVGRTVAVKISAEQFSDRFEREARAVAALNHPKICRLYDVGPNYFGCVPSFLETCHFAPVAGRLVLNYLGTRQHDGGQVNTGAVFQDFAG